jgi:hypothetical protein
MWDELHEYFDADGDGEISRKEYRDGLQKFLGTVILPLPTLTTVTMQQCADEVEKVANQKALERLNQWTQNFHRLASPKKAKQ